jgi:hypothetical protein
MKILAIETEIPGIPDSSFAPHLRAEASEVLGTLPLVREGLIAFELVPLVPYPGFFRLFAEDR